MFERQPCIECKVAEPAVVTDGVGDVYIDFCSLTCKARWDWANALAVPLDDEEAK